MGQTPTLWLPKGGAVHCRADGDHIPGGLAASLLWKMTLRMATVTPCRLRRGTAGPPALPHLQAVTRASSKSQPPLRTEDGGAPKLLLAPAQLWLPTGTGLSPQGGGTGVFSKPLRPHLNRNRKTIFLTREEN